MKYLIKRCFERKPIDICGIVVQIATESVCTCSDLNVRPDKTISQVD